MKKFLSLLFVVAILASFVIIPAHAAGSVSVGPGSLSLKPGESASFSITATSAAGRVDISSSNPSVATVSTSSTWVENGSVSVTVTAVADGSASIIVNCTDVSDTDFNLITGTRSVSVNVATPVTTTASSAANLKSMSVEGFELSPKFDQWTRAYTIVVPKDTKSINLSATPLNANCTVTGTGELKITKLPQAFNIVCKAPNGESVTYTLTVKPAVSANLKSLVVAAIVDLDPAFDPSIYEYKAIVPAGTKAVIVDYIVEELENKDDVIDVKVEGADDLAKSNNTVTITTTSPDGTKTVYTIHIEFADDVIEVPVKEKGGIPAWLVILFIILLIVFSVVCFFVGRKYEASKSNSNYYSGDDDDDYPSGGSPLGEFEAAPPISGDSFIQSAD